MGNEISKALEADVLATPNGVVAEKLLTGDATATDTANARRGASDVAQRQQLFAFCADWDLQRLTDFLRWYARFHDRDAVDKTLDPRGLSDQVDTLESEIATRKALLRQVEEELQLLASAASGHLHPESEESELVRATLESRREEIADELRDRQRAVQDRKVHLLATIEGVELNREVKWRAFIQSVGHVALHQTLLAAAETYTAWHPAAAGFAMARDSQAKKELAEFVKGDIELPPPANHEVDGHTDDSASSSAASEDNGSSRDDGSNDDKNGGDDQVDLVAAVKVGTLKLRTKRTAHEKDDGEEEDDGDDADDEDDNAADQNTPVFPPSATDGGIDQTRTDIAEAPLTAETLADHTEKLAAAEPSAAAHRRALQRPRVIKRPVPCAFDASTRSPVFFGYTLEKRDDELVAAMGDDDALAAKEAKIFDRKLLSRKNQLDDTLKAERGKLDVIQQRDADVSQKRERYWEKRQADLERAKKELDPSDIFFRTRDTQDKKTRDAHTAEDDETRRQKEKIEARIQSAQDEFDRIADQIRKVRATDSPLGEVCIQFHEAEVDQIHAEVLHAKASLATAKEEYVALQSTKTLRIGNQDAKHRAQLLYADDQIHAKERELEAVCVVYEDELFLLQRAQDRFNREQLYRPFFMTLQHDRSSSSSNSDGRDSCFTVLEMACALVVGLGGVPLAAKIGFLFQMFSKRASSRKGTMASTVHLLHREAFAEVLRLNLALFSTLGDFRPRQALSREYFLGLADREFLQLDLVIETANTESTRNGMTSVEFESYCTRAVSKSKYLCELLNVPWRYEQLSRFVAQHMSAVHQYKLGLINVNDLKFAIARQSTSARAELSRWKKDAIHERALAMGENDPLKTDYSKYLPKRRAKLLSKVVPLDHGGYRNLLDYRMEVMVRATTKLQTVWRARKGRQLARLAAEKQAFYHARGVALQAARDAVESDWRAKDDKPAHTVEKMKFEAKIRMKQVKLRTKGNAFSREQVLALLTEEAVQLAQNEVDKRFREMEEDLGYLAHDDALKKPHDDIDYLKEDISKALVAQVVRAKHENEDVALVLDTIALTEEREKKKNKQKQKRSTTDQETRQPVAVGSGNQDGPETGAGERVVEVEQQHVAHPDDKARRLARTQQRQDNMVVGRFPRELFTSGLTRDDYLFKMTQAFPDPPLAALQQRLRQLCVGMTDFKMGELLQELPSKRHICAYAASFRRHDGTYDVKTLESDLLGHFRMVRGARELAEALTNLAESDLEWGLTRELLASVQDQSDAALRQLVARETSAVAEENAVAMQKKLERMGYKSDGLDAAAQAQAQGNPAAVLLQKERHELMDKQKRLEAAHARLIDAMRLWKEAELSLYETQKAQVTPQTTYPILSTHRTKWAERLSTALRLPEANAVQLQAKYTEVHDVCHDFIQSSVAIARVLVRELHLPLTQKSIMPTDDSPVDGRRDKVRAPRRLKYEAHDILFQICTDDHGRCENSDEHAAKCGGHEVRNSALYHRALLGRAHTVLIPLVCVVDFQGYRVLCASKVPIEVVTWNEAGTAIQKVTKQLVHGTENRGRTVTFQSRDLDDLLAEAAAQLNLSRHSVRGYHDLTSKVLHAPADLLGYVDASKRFVLTNFARVMPPEDPEITTHLCGSTRGLSILWRQLRPELVASFKTPLSPDALSSMTYSTPDWLSQATGVEQATRELLEVAIPGFARKLSHKADYFTAPSFNLVQEMHRHGVNLRHLGLLRAQFPFALAGAATLQYATGEIQTTEDFTRQVERGASVYILGSVYHVSRNLKHRFDAHCITLAESYMGDSVQNVTVLAGRQDCLNNADRIRVRLLVEMVARTLKNILRHLMRSAAKLSGTGLTPMLHKRIVVYCLNLLTGRERGSEDSFWRVHLYEGIRVRFGPRAVSEVDQQNLRHALLPALHVVVERLAQMMNIRFRATSLERLRQHPDCYLFVLDDLDDDSGSGLNSGCRVKHNLSMLHFSMASLLLLQATTAQAASYKQLVMSDHPSGYWTLCERRGLSVAANSGSYGKELDGKYLAACMLEAEGPVVNTDLNRAMELRKEKRSYVSFPVVARLYPSTDTSAHVALEAWCKCDGHASTRRVVLTIGRFTLIALKANVWAFSVNVRNIDIVARGAPVELHKWTHLVGTYDGSMLRLFVNGLLQNEVDVESVVDLELAKREAVIAKTRQDIADLEEDARGKCFNEVDREMQQHFASKDGKKQVKTMSQRLLDEHEFRVRLSKAATASAAATSGDNPAKDGAATTTTTTTTTAKRDLSKVTRAEFEPLAKKQLVREQFEARVASIAAEFTEMRRRVDAQIAKELDEQTAHGTRELRIGCLSSAFRRDGKHFFHGGIAHVAYYNEQILTRDQVNAHFVMAARGRAPMSDDLFSLASQRFARALSFAPHDQRTLEKCAENICASLKYDLDHHHGHHGHHDHQGRHDYHAQEMYKKKVKCGLEPFIATENAHGIAEILKNLPREPAFSDLFVDCYRALLQIQPEYIHAVESSDCRLSLRELARLPFQFFLGSRSATSIVNIGGADREREQQEIPVFADVVKRVLADLPSFYGDQLTDMGWLRGLANPRAVVYVVLRAESGEDVRFVDLTDVTDVSNDDMELIIKNNRFALGFSLAQCAELHDVTIMRLALCCSQIEQLDVSYCSLLTDAAMAAVGKHCTRLKKLWLVHCHLISDIGVEAATRANPGLEQLGLSYCERVSERCMATIGASCPNLAVLELELCVQLGSAALQLLAGSLASPAKLRTLNLAGCHRVADDGLLEIARKCTRLRNVNVRLCDKLTNASLRVLTHNNLELEVLNLDDVPHATHELFHFDQEGDGRAVVDKNLASKMRELTLSGGAGMDDMALGRIGHRAKRLEAITLSACAQITDRGLHSLLVEDLLDKSRCGEHLRHLDVSYCPQLTAHGIHRVVLHCPKLVSLNLSGCVYLTDENLVEIVNACTKLVRLELAFCRDLTDAVLLAIASQLSLEVLNVGRCLKVTDDGMRELAGQLTVLRRLNVSACKRLTDATLCALMEACVLLEELDVAHCPHFSREVLARLVRRKVRVVCGKADHDLVADVAEKPQLADQPDKRRVSSKINIPETGPSRPTSAECNEEKDTRSQPHVTRAVVAEATKPTRKTRLPVSDSSLPLIHHRSSSLHDD